MHKRWDIGGVTVEKWGPSVGHRPMAKPVCTVGDRLVLISSLDKQFPFDRLACKSKKKVKRIDMKCGEEGINPAGLQLRHAARLQVKLQANKVRGMEEERLERVTCGTSSSFGISSLTGMRMILATWTE
jgi:hypothetical protein